MPSAAVAGHYDIFNALENKTEQNSENIRLFLKKCKLIAVKMSDDKHLANEFYYLMP